MEIEYYDINQKELQIIKNNIKIKTTQHENVDYFNKVCIKPWGYEFLTFMNNKIGIWYLSINYGHKTSIHTHFNKDTLLICFKGTGLINFIDDEYVILNEFDYIYIPKYKFHGLSSLSEKCFFIEIEIFNEFTNFSDKNDLLRINDIYNRDNTGYTQSVQISFDLCNYNHFRLDKDIELEFMNNIIQSKIYDRNNYNQINNKYLNILIEGEIYIDGIIAKEGTIIKDIEKIKIVSDYFRILSLFSEEKEENSKIINNMEHLKLLIQKIKSKKITLTSGCFDILHVGHLSTLKKASKIGDKLIVCLSSDEQIKKLKGQQRPINCLEDRKNLFKTIQCVDYIVLYDEEDIEKEKTLDDIMKIVSPHTWVKGGDYDIKNILKKHPHLNHIKIIDLIDNKSTTNIIKKITNV